MSEHALWVRVRDNLTKNGCCLHRIENTVEDGMPDVYGHPVGDETAHHWWLELKQVDRWPARPETPVNFGLRPAQRRWLLHHPHLSYALVQVDTSILMFGGKLAGILLDRAPREILLRDAIWIGGDPDTAYSRVITPEWWAWVAKSLNYHNLA